MKAKKLVRTVMTWRFVNMMAPSQPNHMPTKVCKANLVEVTAALFRGKATLTIWFEAMDLILGTNKPVVRDTFGREFRKYIEEIGVRLDYGDDEYSQRIPIWANGPCFCVDLTFELKNGVGFTHTAMQKFVKIVTTIGDEGWRGRYHLPTPQVVQETMVEAYAKDNWITYGEYISIYQPNDPLGPKTELGEGAAKEEAARLKAMG